MPSLPIGIVWVRTSLILPENFIFGKRIFKISLNCSCFPFKNSILLIEFLVLSKCFAKEVNDFPKEKFISVPSSILAHLLIASKSTTFL